MLTLRFVSGLRAEIKKKMPAVEGTFEQILVRARFEEAQWRELKQGSHQESAPIRRYPVSGGQTRQQTGGRSRGALSGQKSPVKKDNSRQENRGGCYHCGSSDHDIRKCPYKERSQPREASGKSNVQVNGLTTRVDALGAENSGEPECQPGPRIVTKLWLDGVEVESLLDTGSPVTIVSLGCLLDIWSVT